MQLRLVQMQLCLLLMQFRPVQVPQNEKAQVFQRNCQEMPKNSRIPFSTDKTQPSDWGGGG